MVVQVTHKTIHLILVSLGILLSTYSLYVEWRLEKNESGAEDQYKPLCDISATASCSRVFTSKYVCLSVCASTMTESLLSICPDMGVD